MPTNASIDLHLALDLPVSPNQAFLNVNLCMWQGWGGGRGAGCAHIGTDALGGVCKTRAKMMNRAPTMTSTTRNSRMMNGRHSLRGMHFAMAAHCSAAAAVVFEKAVPLLPIEGSVAG